MTSPRSTLVSWIGTADLLAYSGSLPDAEQNAFRAKLADWTHRKPGAPEPPGPLRALLEAREFDDVHLLADWWPEAIAGYQAWLERDVIIHERSLSDPSDYAEVVRVTKSVLDGLANKTVRRELHFHLSPGTPTMAAVWFMWANSLFPAQLHQTHRSKHKVVALPYDIEMELRERFERSDRTHRQLVDRELGNIEGFESIVGDSPALRRAKNIAARAAVHDVPVLLLGESGTGKEVFARAIHERSSRKEKPFVAVNVAALPKDIVESELFGHKKGAYSGASSTEVGAFGRAHEGTLFLDEIGECPLDVQVKLLRALEPGPIGPPSELKFTSVGGAEQTVNVRVIAATNRDLLEAIRKGDFREDLYYRISPVVVRLPALRQRRSDISALARYLLGRINRDFASQRQGGEPYTPKTLTDAAIERLQFKQWKGNVRQLRSVLLRAAVLVEGGELDAQEIEDAMDEGATVDAGDFRDRPLPEMHEALAELKTSFISRAMEQGGNVTRAAELLGVKRKTLSDWIEKSDIKADE